MTVIEERPPAAGLEGIAITRDLPAVDAAQRRFIHAALDAAWPEGMPPGWRALLIGALSAHPNDAARISATELAVAALRFAAGPAEELFGFIDPAKLAAPLPPMRYPVRGFAMAPGPVTLFLSFSYGGKSVILQDLLLSVSLGLPVWQMFRSVEGPVVHFDYEQGEAQTIDRYQRLARARNIPLESIADGRIQIAPYPRGNIYSPGAEEAFKRVLDGKSVALIDTFNAASPGRDENEAGIAEGLYMLGKVSEVTGCTIILAHHMGKSSLATGRDAIKDPRMLARGSTSIVAAAGYVYALEGKKGDPKFVQQAKARGLGDPQVEDFYLDLAAVDVRESHGFKNYENPGDLGGFLVTYKTVEQVKPPKAAEEDPTSELLSAAVLACLEKAGRDGLNKNGLRLGAREAKVKHRNGDAEVVAERLAKAGKVYSRKLAREIRFYLPSMAPPALAIAPPKSA